MNGRAYQNVTGYLRYLQLLFVKNKIKGNRKQPQSGSQPQLKAELNLSIWRVKCKAIF